MAVRTIVTLCPVNDPGRPDSTTTQGTAPQSQGNPAFAIWGLVGRRFPCIMETIGVAEDAKPCASRRVGTGDDEPGEDRGEPAERVVVDGADVAPGEGNQRAELADARADGGDGGVDAGLHRAAGGVGGRRPAGVARGEARAPAGRRCDVPPGAVPGGLRRGRRRARGAGARGLGRRPAGRGRGPPRRIGEAARGRRAPAPLLGPGGRADAPDLAEAGRGPPGRGRRVVGRAALDRLRPPGHPDPPPRRPAPLRPGRPGRDPGRSARIAPRVRPSRVRGPRRGRRGPPGPAR